MSDARQTASDLRLDEPGRLSNLAARLAVTEGQLWSMGLGLALVIVASTFGLPGLQLFRDDAVLAALPAPVGGAKREATPPADVAPIAPMDVAINEDRTLPSVSLAGPPETVASESASNELSVASGGYAVADEAALANGLVPVAVDEVPEGSVAVGRTAARPSKVAFLRLRGGGSTLVLRVDRSSGARNILDQEAALVLCPIRTRSWRVGHGDTALGDAPPYDCSVATPLLRQSDGDTWKADFKRPAGDVAPDGIAIVPAEGVDGLNFQVNFVISGEVR